MKTLLKILAALVAWAVILVVGVSFGWAGILALGALVFLVLRAVAS